MLSLRELSRAALVLAAGRRDARVEKIVQTGETTLVLVLAGGAERPPSDRCALVLCCDRRFARLGVRARAGAALPAPPAFAQYLKAHLQGARLREVSLRGGDRQVALGFESREGQLVLLLSLLGPRSNVYLLDGEGVLLRSLRPVAETRRDLAPGQPWRDPEGRPPSEGADRFEAVEDARLVGEIERHYAAEEAHQVEDQLARRVRQALSKQRAAHARKEKQLRRDLAEGEGAAEFERMGELLKGVLPEVRPKASEVVARDFETGEERTIPLDPALSAAANLERLFKKHRKLEKKRLRAATELGALAERQQALARLAAAAEAASDDPEALAELAAGAELARLLERFAPALPAARPATAPRPRPMMLGKREIPTRLQPKRYRSSDGLEVWVGKNDEGNDLLTTRLSRGRDLFFHLEGSPGSHVVLRMEGKGEPPQESLLEASELAVHFSKQKQAGRASVHVAAIRDVSKPRGAKPGLVYVHRGRTLQLRRDEARLRRILDSRLDD